MRQKQKNIKSVVIYTGLAFRLMVLTSHEQIGVYCLHCFIVYEGGLFFPRLLFEIFQVCNGNSIFMRSSRPSCFENLVIRVFSLS